MTPSPHSVLLRFHFEDRDEVMTVYAHEIPSVGECIRLRPSHENKLYRVSEIERMILWSVNNTPIYDDKSATIHCVCLSQPGALVEDDSKAWEIYFAGWQHANCITDPVKELGLEWSGEGGENQLKETFRAWYNKWIVTNRKV